MFLQINIEEVSFASILKNENKQIKIILLRYSRLKFKLIDAATSPILFFALTL